VYLKLSNQSHSSNEVDIQHIKNQFETEIQRIDFENKRLKQQLDEKNRDIDNWQERYNRLERDNMKVSPKADVTKYEIKIAEYESRFVMFGQ